MMLVPKKDFDIFEDWFNDPFFTSHENKLMKTDIKECSDKFKLYIDLPGFAKEDIKMHMDNGYLVIHAKTSHKDDESDGKFVKKERYYGECSRSFYVGDHLTEEDIKAKFNNGILNIEIPKKEEIKRDSKKYIEIK